jgi:hypothetical protein
VGIKLEIAIVSVKILGAGFALFIIALAIIFIVAAIVNMTINIWEHYGNIITILAE